MKNERKLQDGRKTKIWNFTKNTQTKGILMQFFFSLENNNEEILGWLNFPERNREYDTNL